VFGKVGEEERADASAVEGGEGAAARCTKVSEQLNEEIERWTHQLGLMAPTRRSTSATAAHSILVSWSIGPGFAAASCTMIRVSSCDG